MAEKIDRFARITRDDLQALAKKRLSQQETLVFLAYRYTCWESENLRELVQLVDLPASTVQRLVCRLKNAGLIESDDPNASRVCVHDRARSRGARSCTIVHDPAIRIQKIKEIDQRIDLNPSAHAPDLQDGSRAHTREAEPKSGRAGDQELISYLCKLFSIGEKLARRLVAKGSALCAEVPIEAPSVTEWRRFAFWAANEPTLAKSEAKFAASLDRLVPWILQTRAKAEEKRANDAARSVKGCLPPTETTNRAVSLVSEILRPGSLSFERNRGLDRREQGGAG